MTTPNNNSDSSKTIINFLFQELAKTLEDVQNGKKPEMSETLKSLASDVEILNKKQATESEIKEFTDKLVSKINKE